MSKLFAAVLVGVLSVGCVNNHFALLEVHSIGPQYKDCLKDCGAKKSELALESCYEHSNDCNSPLSVGFLLSMRIIFMI